MTFLKTLSTAPHRTEVAAALPGDDLVPDARVTMDRGFDLPAPPGEVWPWPEQLGTGRAVWFLPRSVERLLPRPGRGLRHIDPDLQHLQVGQIVDDWGGRDATFEIITHEPPTTLVHWSLRGAAGVSWTIVVTAQEWLGHSDPAMTMIYAHVETALNASPAYAIAALLRDTRVGDPARCSRDHRYGCRYAVRAMTIVRARQQRTRSPAGTRRPVPTSTRSSRTPCRGS